MKTEIISKIIEKQDELITYLRTAIWDSKILKQLESELSSLKEAEAQEKDETFCSQCIHYNDLMRKAGIQSRCNKFKEVCVEVNCGGHCSSFEVQEKVSDEDILKWADSKERRLTSYHMGLQDGAKAMRGGLIKKGE